ncbi:MAG: iron donor protein CyaY [Acidimicrobiia bacterium]|nr:iron donor protein CyaY [Acidimicrobiia bacterium]
MDEQEFRRRADEELQQLYRVLGDAGEEHDFEADFNAGALSIQFEEPEGRFVVSPNAPVRQIWVSANVKSYKLDWEDARGEFVLGSTGQSLRQLMGEAIETHLGHPVKL